MSQKVEFQKLDFISLFYAIYVKYVKYVRVRKIGSTQKNILNINTDSGKKPKRIPTPTTRVRSKFVGKIAVLRGLRTFTYSAEPILSLSALHIRS